jgi:apolipoprotein N-acyltransferase
MTRGPAAVSLRATTAAFALGAFCVLGFAPFNSHFPVWPAPTLALGGLFLLWRKADSARAAMLLGLAWGAGCFLFGVSWVYVSLSQFGGMAAARRRRRDPGFLSLPRPVSGAGRRALRCAGGAARQRDALLFAGLWTLSEWLRGTLFTGFPWLAVGYSQSPPSPLAGWASVLGVYGVGFVVALIGALLFCGWRKPRVWVTILLLLVVAAC